VGINESMVQMIGKAAGNDKEEFTCGVLYLQDMCGAETETGI
jgi:hypothetical protein